LPNTRGPSQAARKPQQTPPNASSIEIDVSQEDFAAMTNLARTTVGTVLGTLESRSTRITEWQLVLAGRGGHNYSGRQIRLLHLAAIRVDRPVHEMMIFAKSLLCSFLRLGAGVGERLEGVLAGVDFVAISAKHLLKESHTKAAHYDLHCLLGHNKRVLERIFDLPQRCVRECADSHPASRAKI
jgi:hypothetical protein